MKHIDKLIEGLNILKKYNPDPDIRGSADVVMIDLIDSTVSSKEDENRLLELGWDNVGFWISSFPNSWEFPSK